MCFENLLVEISWSQCVDMSPLRVKIMHMNHAWKEWPRIGLTNDNVRKLLEWHIGMNKFYMIYFIIVLDVPHLILNSNSNDLTLC